MILTFLVFAALGGGCLFLWRGVFTYPLGVYVRDGYSGAFRRVSVKVAWR